MTNVAGAVRRKILKKIARKNSRNVSGADLMKIFKKKIARKNSDL